MCPHGSNLTEGGSSEHTTHSTLSPPWCTSANDSTTACKAYREEINYYYGAKKFWPLLLRKNLYFTLQRKHFFSIGAQSMQATKWPHGEKVALAGKSHTRHLRPVSMETPEDELDDACGEAPFDVWDFFGVALQKKKHKHTHNQTKTSLSHEVSLTAVLWDVTQHKQYTAKETAC